MFVLLRVCISFATSVQRKKTTSCWGGSRTHIEPGNGEPFATLAPCVYLRIVRRKMYNIIITVHIGKLYVHRCKELVLDRPLVLIRVDFVQNGDARRILNVY